MGRQSRIKRERREHADFTAGLTLCEGTWLEQPATAEEQQRIDAAFKVLREQRKLAVDFYQDPNMANVFSIELFRDEAFKPMELEDWLIEKMIAEHGEPPIIEEGDEETFSNYLRDAILSIATSRVRTALAAQLRRYLPRYVDAGQWKEAVAIDYNAFRTALGNEVSPFLVQMALAGFARYYDAYEAEGEADEAQAG